MAKRGRPRKTTAKKTTAKKTTARKTTTARRKSGSDGLTIAQLEKKAKAFEDAARKLRRFCRQLRRLADENLDWVSRFARGTGGSRRTRTSTGTSPGAGKRLAAPRGKTGRGAGAAALAVLQEKGVPMRAGELLPEVLKRGINVGGQNPKATLASTLLKYPPIERVARGLFAPAKGADALKPKPAKKRAAKKKAGRKTKKTTKKATKKTAKKTAKKPAKASKPSKSAAASPAKD